jgi:hypothetical protein
MVACQTSPQPTADCRSPGGLRPGMELDCGLTSARGNRGENYENESLVCQKHIKKKQNITSPSKIFHSGVLIQQRLVKRNCEYKTLKKFRMIFSYFPPLSMSVYMTRVPQPQAPPPHPRTALPVLPPGQIVGCQSHTRTRKNIRWTCLISNSVLNAYSLCCQHSCQCKIRYFFIKFSRSSKRKNIRRIQLYFTVRIFRIKLV